MKEKDNVLYADDGKFVTDGEITGKVIYLAEGADKSKFFEISEEENLSAEGSDVF